jgi:hypothetical protein
MVEIEAPAWAAADGPVEELLAGGASRELVRARAWLRRFDRGWEVRDPDLLVEPVRADASVLYTLMPGETDREGLRRYLANALAMPEMRLRPGRWDAAGDDVWIEWDASAVVGGQPVEWHGIDHFTFEGDEIVRARAVYDPRPVLEAVAGQR